MSSNLKLKVSRYAEFPISDLKNNISRWIGEICTGIGNGDLRTAVWKIWDEINENAFVHGYNTAIKNLTNSKEKVRINTDTTN